MRIYVDASTPLIALRVAWAVAIGYFLPPVVLEIFEEREERKRADRFRRRMQKLADELDEMQAELDRHQAGRHFELDRMTSAKA